MTDYVLIFLVGILGGFINTLAGSGSLLILPLLIFTGLDPVTANGTLRLGILMQSITAVSGFKKNEVFRWSEGLFLAIPAFFGALLGSLTAVNISQNLMKYFIAGLLVVMFFLLLLKPQTWLKTRENVNTPKWLVVIIFFALGFYGGFIQAGIGFFLISALVFAVGYDLKKANAVKMLIVMLYTPVALMVFALNNNVDYYKGIALSLGMILGAFFAVKLAIKKGSAFIRYFLLLAILVSAIKMLFF